jgi:hypothetical protein
MAGGRQSSHLDGPVSSGSSRPGPSCAGFALEELAREPLRCRRGSHGEENDMTHLLPPNEHRFDRIARVAAGLGLLSLTVLGPQTLWGLVGLVPLVTGLVGSCPLYSIFGLTTSRTRSVES